MRFLSKAFRAVGWVLLSTTVGAIGQELTAPPGWVRVQPSSGGFSISFPLNPHKEIQESSGEAFMLRRPLLMTTYSSPGQSPGMMYACSYTDVPLLGVTPTRAELAAMMRDVSQANSGVVQRTMPIAVDGYPGVEATIKIKTPQLPGFAIMDGIETIRIVALDRRVFLLGALGPEPYDPNVAARFLNSFSILPKPRRDILSLARRLMAAALVLVRVVILLLGMLLTLFPALMYEPEVTRLEDRMTGLWIKIDDRRKRTLSRSTIFLREASRLTGHRLDRLLGPRLISFRSVTLFAAYSIGSSTLLLWWYEFEPEWWGVWLISISLAALVPFVRKDRTANVFLVGIWVTLLYPSPFLRGELRLGGYFFIFVAVLLGICVAAFNRFILRRASSAASAWPVGMLMAANLLLFVLLIGPFLYSTIIRTYPSLFEPQITQVMRLPIWFLLSIVELSFLNLATALAVMAIFLTIAAALLHRLFWASWSRALYHLPDFVRKPKLTLIVIGLCMMTIAAQSPDWLSLASKVRDALTR
jgi:hypothetical protein